ncbi:MAG: hypothetical protein U0350_50395 [Caldilineaceae bacterium]
MSNNNNNNNNGIDLYTTVDDELFEELNELVGQKVVYAGFWEDSLEDALDQTETDPADQIAFDLDLYLDDGIYFELYSAVFYPDLDSEALKGRDVVSQRMIEMGKKGIWLEEIAVDENDELVLVLSDEGEASLYLSIAGWRLEEWDELPED